MSGLGGHLRDVVTYGMWSLTGSFTNYSNLTEGGTNWDFGQVVAL